MRSFLSRRPAAALLLTLLLAALSPGLALAGSPRRPAEPRQSVTASVLSRLGDWLRAFVAENGAELDPSGAPKNVSPAPPPGPAATTDNGAEVDPNGRL